MAFYVSLGLTLMLGCSQLQGVMLSDEKRLTGTLLQNYLVGANGFKFGVPPLVNASGKLTVNFGVTLIEADIDTSLRVLTTKCYLRYTWQDSFLRWNPEDFGGVSVIRVPISSIWQPDIKLYNSYDLKMELDDTALALVYNSGTVLWVPPARIRSRCALERGHEWNCTLRFGSWTFDGHRVDIDFADQVKDVDLESFNVALWEVVEHGAHKNSKHYPCCEEPYPQLVFNMKMRRHYN